MIKLGKGFVVLILAMSLVFLGMSLMVYATHKNWPAIINRTAQEAKAGEPIGLKHQLTEAKQNLAEREAQRTKLNTEVDGEVTARRLSLAKLEIEKIELQNEYEKLVKLLVSLKEETRVGQEMTKQHQQMLDAKLAEINALREQMEKAYDERDSQFEKSIHLEDELHQSANELERAKANTKGLRH
jgi:Na+-transporting methylmalonyl-CoA/oxaloacetate decarboxylase gamma subunit